jgi:hypothetical protein
VFGNLTSGQPAALIGERPAPEAAELSARMRSAWTAFAAAGDPGWPAYDADRRLTQVFDVPARVTADPEEGSRLIRAHHAFPILVPARRPHRRPRPERRPSLSFRDVARFPPCAVGTSALGLVSLSPATYRLE